MLILKQYIIKNEKMLPYRSKMHHSAGSIFSQYSYVKLISAFRAARGVLSSFVRQLQYGVTLRAAAVSEVFDVSDAVLLQDEPAFRRVPQLQKGFILAAAFVFLL